MDTLKLNFHDLHNGEHFQFHTDFINLVKDDTTLITKIRPLFDSYNQLYITEDRAYKGIDKSGITEEIVSADKLRDRFFRGMVDTTKTALLHYDATVETAAKRLMIVFDTYGNLAVENYKKETADIYNLLQELNTNYPAEILTVGIQGWMTNLNIANQRFEQLSKDRVDETYQKGDFDLRTCRINLDEAYSAITKRIEALAEVEGLTAYLEFISKLNIIIKMYKTIIARRKNGGKDEDIDEEEIPTED